jgi:hypothetical protein
VTRGTCQETDADRLALRPTCLSLIRFHGSPCAETESGAEAARIPNVDVTTAVLPLCVLRPRECPRGGCPSVRKVDGVQQRFILPVSDTPSFAPNTENLPSGRGPQPEHLRRPQHQPADRAITPTPEAGPLIWLMRGPIVLAVTSGGDRRRLSPCCSRRSRCSCQCRCCCARTDRRRHC